MKNLPKLILCLAIWTPQLALAEADPYQSEGLLQEVISSVKTPHAFDWRRNDYELGIRYGYFDEANNFENQVYELLFGFPTSGGSVIRLLLRRVAVFGTYSSNLLGRTPFTQDAGQNRYGLGIGIAFGLMEGKSITRLSPAIPDLEHSFRLVANAGYSHLNDGGMPAKSDVPERLPGQEPQNSKYVIELGLEWQIYFPQSWGIQITGMWHKPLQNSGRLTSWWQYGTGLVWSL